jgi:nitrous oxide reductase accessory protein NosL
VCCARCAISEANQERKHLRLVTVHDYPTSRAIAPDHAWFVEGSRAMACGNDAMPMNEMKGMDMKAFDRCSPSTVAFAERQAADAFVAENGGAVLSFAQLMSEARFQ